MKKGCTNAAINLYSFLCMPVINSQKNGKKQRVFEWVKACFPWKKWRQKRFKCWHSNIPFIRKSSPKLPSNQPDVFDAKQRGIETNMKQKEQFVSEFLTTEKSTLEKVQRKQQSNIPVALEMLVASAKEFFWKLQ